MFEVRASQQEILSYHGGLMGIVAVPGSGKTWTLSLLAAEIIARKWLQPGQEVLIVTLVNSAVDHFYQRVRSFLKQRDLMPLDFRVRTLHGLAHDIVRERPEIVGLGDNFQIIDEREAERIRQEVSQSWLHSHPDALEQYLSPELDEKRRDWIFRTQLPELVNSIALDFIRYAKDQQISPGWLRQKLDQLPLPLPLAEMGYAIYMDYQRALNYRGGVDFDDLICLAAQALEWDQNLLERLSNRWPYILEDEAQDSSSLQEQILRNLVSLRSNWIRVGDPNQAIYETFTTAKPDYLRNFVRETGVIRRELPESGRSTESIIWLANSLVRWTQFEYPLVEVRDALQSPPEIKSTPSGDPQPNPLDDPLKISLIIENYTPQEEIQGVANSLSNWLPEHPEETVAVLVPRNVRGFEVVDALRRKNLEVIDTLLRSTATTRFSAGALGNLLRYLANPQSATKLVVVWKVWSTYRNEGVKAQQQQRIRPREYEMELIRKCDQIEDFLWPQLGRDWLADLESAGEDKTVIERLSEFRKLVNRWQQAILLPIDQLLLSLAQDLFTSATELAITHKLAAMLRQVSNSHPDWQLPELIEELAVIARNERRFLGLDKDESGFDPNQYKGKVLVATVHKAKGLEWDRVYLMSVNNYDYPSGEICDTYIPEKWFIRDNLNIEAESLEQLKISLEASEYVWYVEGEATRKARLDYIRERLRLLYVGITRAKKELVITWNTGRDGKRKQALAFGALQGLWEEHLREIAR